ncbi:MAG TPA: hypothetical protein VJV75_07325 [Candidatus Polarisedimenticolia bacterium]|nr:hypothetical protein [Candidatus Polarisedimenticolia bacterium]
MHRLPVPPSVAAALAFVALAVPTHAFAQASASYRLTEFTANSGGDPSQGAFASSASHRITLDAVGDGALGSGLASATQHIDGGFVPLNPPPGEVTGFLFTDGQTLIWSPERSVGRYEVYRAPVSTLAGGGTGACFVTDVSGETTTDASIPGVGTGYFYLVTARNRLGEEGTKGFRSNGVERANPLPCP